MDQEVIFPVGDDEEPGNSTYSEERCIYFNTIICTYVSIYR